MIGIYKITSPTGRVYIGQTVDIVRRFKQYKKGISCSTQVKLHSSLQKHGISNHLFEVVEECEVSYLNERERYWQEYYNVVEKGLNCRLTSTRDKTGILSEDTRQKMSQARKGKTHSQEVKSRMSRTRTGKSHSEETRQKMREAKLGIKRGSYIKKFVN